VGHTTTCRGADHGLKEADLGDIGVGDLPLIDKELLMEHFEGKVGIFVHDPANWSIAQLVPLVRGLIVPVCVARGSPPALPSMVVMPASRWRDPSPSWWSLSWCSPCRTQSIEQWKL
jgi:hypothetical protein